MAKKKKKRKIQGEMEKCLALLAITDIQMKTMLRFHLIPLRMVIIKETNNKKSR
jgi:hypothetical protein